MGRKNFDNPKTAVFTDDPTTTVLAVARDWLRKHAIGTNGAWCPCCQRRAKIYQRKFNAGMAYMLIQIYNKELALQPVNGWLHITKEFLQDRQNAVAREYSKLRHFGLLEAKPTDDPTVRGSGFWRLTQFGRDFAQGKTVAPAFIIEFDSKKIEESPKKITIQEALGNSFDWYQLMSVAKPTAPVTVF